MSRQPYLFSVISASKDSNWLHFLEHNVFLFTPWQTLKHLCMINSTQVLLRLRHATPSKYGDNNLCILAKLQADISTFHLKGEHLQF